MRVLKEVVHGPGDLKLYFPSSISTNQLFLNNVLEPKVGESLCIWFHLPRHHADVFVQGQVVWQRYQASPALSMGTAIQVNTGQMAELAFLGRVIERGVTPLPERRHPRIPILEPWSCKVTVPEIDQWSWAQVMNISSGGARLQSQLLPVVEGTLVQVDLTWHSGSTHELELAWHNVEEDQQLLGLNRLPKASIHENEWTSLVQRANQAFELEMQPH